MFHGADILEKKGKRIAPLGLRWRVLSQKDDTRSNREF